MNRRRMGVFSKAVIALLLLMLPIFACFIYIYNVNVTLLKGHIIENKNNEVRKLSQLADAFIMQVEAAASAFLREPDVKDLEHYAINPAAYTSSGIRQLQNRIRTRMNTHVAQYKDNLFFALHAPALDVIVGVNIAARYVQPHFQEESFYRWTPVLMQTGINATQTYWVKQFSQYLYSETRIPKNKIEVGISTVWLADLLAEYTYEGNVSVFSARENQRLFMPSSRLHESTEGPLAQIPLEDAQGHQMVMHEGRETLLSYSYCNGLDGYFIMRCEMSGILAPLGSIRITFMAAMALTIVVVFSALFILNQHVRVPIRDLNAALSRMTQGHYETRVTRKPSNEFDGVLARFNEMAENTDQLINHVHQAQLHARDATFRQYQAQINPHFLYNCLFFTKNMAAMEDHESVISIVLHLAEFYRYTTRVDEQTTSIGKEIELIRHYLSIMQMRTDRLTYTIEIEPAMLDVPMPKLMLQPIVENAVCHGIEYMESPGEIHIAGRMEAGRCILRVENNGAYLDTDKIRAISDQSNAPEPGSSGYGLWNVVRRMKLFFGEDATIVFQGGAEGGLTVTLSFTPPAAPD